MVVSMFVTVNSLRFAYKQNREAIVKVLNAGVDIDSGVHGTLYLRQTKYGVQITGNIDGLEPGKHGFHVHAEGDLGNACKNAKGHFNPLMVNIQSPKMNIIPQGVLRLSGVEGLSAFL